MKLYVKGRGNREVNLSQRDLVGQGGQGTVFAQGQTAYKVYHDPKDMLPEGKIQELAEIRDPHVIRPRDVLITKSGQPVGYTTTFVQNAWVLCQLFPIAFRQREGLTPRQTLDLVGKLQERIANVHAAGVLVVDANEMNFLVAKNFSEVYAIDVDSYQTAHYPAPAIMESIRDWSAKTFTELSDWFSFAVLAFQMFVGIHPFKGRYHGRKQDFRVKLSTDAPDDAFAITRRRMQQHISVFHKDVSVPGATLPFATIPDSYRRWFEALFAKGERSLPPSASAPVVVIPAAVTAPVGGTDKLDVLEIGTFEGVIVGVWTNGSTTVVATDQGVWIDGARIPVSTPRVPGCAFSPRNGRAVLAWTMSGAVGLFDGTDRCPVTAAGMLPLSEEYALHDGRMYLRTSGSVFEVQLNDMGTSVYPTVREVARVLPYASRLYPGVVVQRMLGSTFVSLLVGPGAAQQGTLSELNDYRVVDAKYDGGVLMVVGEKRGRFDRLVFRFGDDVGQHDVRVIQGIAHTGLNFVVLDSGVCVCLDEEDHLEVFRAKPGSVQIQHVEIDPKFSGLRLWKRSGKVLASRGNRLYQLGMKG